MRPSRSIDLSLIMRTRKGRGSPPFVDFVGGSLVLFELEGRNIAQRGMQPLSIVKHLDVTEHLLFSFLARRWDAIPKVIKALGFEGRPEALHQGVVITISLAAHALDDIAILQEVAEQFTGVLAAASPMMNRGIAVG